MDSQSNGTLTQPRWLYQLICQPGRITDHTFEITFLDSGIQACAFTFGSIRGAGLVIHAHGEPGAAR